MVCHEIDHLNGLTILDWKVSEGMIEMMFTKEEISDALNDNIDHYKDEISDYKQTSPDSFIRDKDPDSEFEQDGIKWKQFKKGYPNDKYTVNDEKFDYKYLMDMYKAEKKDQRKKELKNKYFDSGHHQ